MAVVGTITGRVFAQGTGDLGLPDATVVVTPGDIGARAAKIPDANNNGRADCALPLGVNPIMAPRLNIFGNIADKADVDGDGYVTTLDALEVLEGIGDVDDTKVQNGDCLVWADDVAAVLEEAGN
jgi:hypothetical protein